MQGAEKNTNKQTKTNNASGTSTQASFIGYIKRIFALDTRSLALLRIGIGCVILIDLGVRIFYLTAFHTDLGILPSAVIMDTYSSENIWSLHLIASTYGYQLFLFLLHAGIALAFIVGRKTKTMSILLWIFTLSMHGHNPLILNGGDTFTRLILFRGMFLPRGHQWSLDNKVKQHDPISVFSLATVGFVCQLCFVYIFSAILKDHPRWTSEFTATYYALSLDAFRTSFGDRLYQYPGLMKGLTAFSYYLESLGLILLIIPWKQWLRRSICIGLFLVFHIGLGVGLHLYAFPWIMSFAWITLVPSTLWNKLATYLSGQSYTFLKQSKEFYQQKFTFIISLLLILSLLYSFGWNLRTTDFDRYDDYFPRDINRFGFLLRIDQYRNMFAPYPFVDNGWIQIAGYTKDGTEVNLMHHDKAFTLDEPDRYQTHLKHERWRKYLTSMWMKDNSSYRIYGANYFCHQRNTSKSGSNNKVEEIKRRYMVEKTLEDYESVPTREVLLYEGNCP